METVAPPYMEALKDAELSGDQARKLSNEGLQNFHLMQSQMEDAKQQVKDYGNILNKRLQTMYS